MMQIVRKIADKAKEACACPKNVTSQYFGDKKLNCGFWWDYPTLIGWGVDTVSSNNPASVAL